MAQTLHDQVKTAYVLKFIKFTEWPAGAVGDEEITLCVAGKNVLGGMLASLDGRQAGMHKVHVVTLLAETLVAPNPASFKTCQVLFIGESERTRLSSLLRSAGDAPVLTISDIADFAENGGDIGLFYREGKIIFEVNMISVQRSKLRLPSQLLNLASYIFRQ